MGERKLHVPVLKTHCREKKKHSMEDGAKLSKLNGGNRPRIAFGISVLLHIEYTLFC